MSGSDHNNNSPSSDCFMTTERDSEHLLENSFSVWPLIQRTNPFCVTDHQFDSRTCDCTSEDQKDHLSNLDYENVCSFLEKGNDLVQQKQWQDALDYFSNRLNQSSLLCCSICPSLSYTPHKGPFFHTGKLHRLLKETYPTIDPSLDSIIYLSVVLEYLTTKVIEWSSLAASLYKDPLITPKHLLLVCSERHFYRCFRTSIHQTSSRQFSSCIYSLLHFLKHRISVRACDLLDSFLLCIFQSITRHAVRLLRLGHKTTLTSREIHTATILTFPRALVDHIPVQNNRKKIEHLS
ncbi:hypothetical protein RCL1_008350 [Eukaryota sp. TZLM3-RCL]